MTTGGRPAVPWSSVLEKERTDSLTSAYRSNTTLKELELRFSILDCDDLFSLAFREGGIDQAGRVISTIKLNALLRFYPWPINVVVYHDSSGKVNLGRGLALRCFQRLSLPNIAAQHCR